jgi:hypothetical protein
MLGFDSCWATKTLQRRSLSCDLAAAARPLGVRLSDRFATAFFEALFIPEDLLLISILTDSGTYPFPAAHFPGHAL